VRVSSLEDKLTARVVKAAPLKHSGGDSIVKSARRSLQILEVFAECRRPLKLTEIAHELEMPPSSTSALLKSLMQLGYLSLNPETRAFFPTQMVAFLGSWLADDDQQGTLSALLAELSRLTRETVILGVEAGRYVQYVNVVQGSHPIRYHTKPGIRRALPAANLGIALLSRKEDGAIGLILRALNAQMRPDEKQFVPGEVMRNVRLYRSQGYIYRPSILVPGAGVIGTLLPIQPVMAVGIGGVAERLTEREREIVGILRRVITHFFGDARTPLPSLHDRA
jgi:DNA-binding IclR family transcriptional regulator